MIERVLLTGGAGFIGSNFARKLLGQGQDFIGPLVIVDNLSYAGHRDTIADVLKDSRLVFVESDIRNGAKMAELIQQYQVDAVINFAAESHVDKSIDSPKAFVETNSVGTFELLEASRQYFKSLSAIAKERFRFFQISTDEVFGALSHEGAFTEETPYAPNSPYSASKASADHWVRAYQKTYGLPTLLTNCSNNFGPYQFPEKLIPVVIQKALRGDPIPVYGRGEQVRDWLFVEDHCDALLSVLTKAPSGSRYVIGGGHEVSNLELVKHICSILDEIRPKKGKEKYADQIAFVTDRPGHDFRYAIDAAKIKNELGWKPRHAFADAMLATLKWYLENTKWCDAVLGTDNVIQRQGIG